MYRFIGEGPTARHDTHNPFLVDKARHDADLTLYSARAGLLKFSVAEQVLRVLDGLRISIYHPALDWLDENGRRRVLDGLDEFREHLGGELTVLLLKELGEGVDIHQIDETLLGECINELRTRWENLG